MRLSETAIEQTVAFSCQCQNRRPSDPARAHALDGSAQHSIKSASLSHRLTQVGEARSTRSPISPLRRGPRLASTRADAAQAAVFAYGIDLTHRSEVGSASCASFVMYCMRIMGRAKEVA